MKNEPKKMVALCFDDGLKSQYEAAQRIDKEYGFKFSYAVVTSFADNHAQGHLTWVEIKDLQSKGMDIVSHGAEHYDVGSEDMTLPQVKNNVRNILTDSKKALSEHGIFTDIFVYPYGNHASEQAVQDAVKEHYQWARGAYRSHNQGRYNLPAVGMVWNNPTVFFAELDRPEKLTILFYHDLQVNPQGFNIEVQQFWDQMDYLKKLKYDVVTLKEALSDPRISNTY